MRDHGRGAMVALMQRIEQRAASIRDDSAWLAENATPANAHAHALSILAQAKALAEIAEQANCS